MLSSKSQESCETYERLCRNSSNEMSFTEILPISTFPLSGSISRPIRLNNVVFPAPEGPTIAVVFSAWAVNVIPVSYTHLRAHET